MAETSTIEWTDATWNPITGCSVVSPGCTNCYAMRLAGTRMKHHPSREGLTTMSKAGPVWNGKVRLNRAWLSQPIRWKRPREIFVCAHSDLFQDAVLGAWIFEIFLVMGEADQHTYQVLTKRPDSMADFCGRLTAPLNHVWLGVSIEDQKRADERRPAMKALADAGWNVWVSYEPALGPVDWTGWDFAKQIVAGGESGPGARPSHPDWYRVTRDWCAARGIAFFFKQWGQFAILYDRADDPEWTNCGRIADENPTGRWLNLAGGHGFHGERVVFAKPIGKKAAGRLLDGVIHDARPGDVA